MAEKNDKWLQMEKDIAERCKIMDDPSYDSGPPLNKADFVGIVCIALVSIIALIIGMTSM